MSMDQLRQSLANSKPSIKGQWIEEGEHVFEVKMTKTSLNQGKLNFIAELTILNSTRADYPAGAPRSYVESFANAGADARVMSFLCACAGFDPSKATPAQIEEAKTKFYAGQQQDSTSTTYVGKRLFCRAFAGTSKGKGTPITNKNWMPLELVVQQAQQGGGQ